MGTSVERHSAGGNDLHAKFTFVPGIKLNGFDVFEVRQAIKFAREYSLANGPIFLNVNTYRYHGHSMSDPGITYRNKEEVGEVRRTNDPIQLIKRIMIDNGVMDQEGLTEIETEIKARLLQEAQESFESPEPALESLTEDVFTKDFPVYIRGPNYEDSIFIKEKNIQ